MTLAIVCIVVVVLSVRIYNWYKQHQFEQAVIVNEFEDRDDPYAGLAYVIDPMRDDIHVEQAKMLLKARALYHGQSPLIFTCTTCKSQEFCPKAFDFYNVDGDCLMTK